MTEIMYKDFNGEFQFANQVEIVSEYGGGSYGIVGELSDIKDTVTGEHLRVGDIVFYDTELPLTISGISFVVKNDKKESDEEPDFFIMGMKLMGGTDRFKYIIKTSKEIYDIHLNKDFNFSLYLKDAEEK